MTMPADRIPASLRSDDPGCGSLRYSIPVVSQGIAFVDTIYSCGPLCAHGWRYALKRQDGRWQLIALGFAFIS